MNSLVKITKKNLLNALLEGIKGRGIFFIAGDDANWYNSFERQFGSISQN